GIPIFENQNGRIMEADGGASVADMRIRDGKRQSVFRAYVFPRMDQPNLTVLPHALVTRLTFEGNRTTGVEISYEGSTRRIRAGCEVVLSLGAIHTPKVKFAVWYRRRSRTSSLWNPGSPTSPGSRTGVSRPSCFLLSLGLSGIATFESRAECGHIREE